MNMIDFTGKTFIVSGIGGIGAETTKLLDSWGAKIILMDIDEKNIIRTKELLSGDKHFGYVL